MRSVYRLFEVINSSFFLDLKKNLGVNCTAVTTTLNPLLAINISTHLNPRPQLHMSYLRCIEFRVTRLFCCYQATTFKVP